MRIGFFLIFKILVLAASGQNTIYLTSILKPDKFNETNSYLTSGKYQIKLTVDQDSLFIKKQLAFKKSGDSLVKYELAFKKYVLISFYDTSMRKESVGIEYWKKGRCILISIKKPSLYYTLDLGGRFNSLSLRKIDVKDKIVWVYDRSTSQLISINMFSQNQ